jgi:AP-1 complex subunit mu
MEYVVKVKAQFKRRSTANNVEIYVPVPEDADSPRFRVGSTCDQGDSTYVVS